MITVRRQFWLQILTLCSGGIAYLALTIYVSPLWLLGLLAMLFGAGYGLMQLECELCGDPLLRREHQLFGRDIAVWWPVLPEQCPTCESQVASMETAAGSLDLALAN